MHCPRLFFKIRTGNGSVSLAASEDLAAWQVECRVFDMTARVTQKAGLGKGKNNASYTRPVDGSRAHRAGFGAGVEGAGGEFGVGKELSRSSAGEQFGMLGWISGGSHGIVAGLDYDFSGSVDNKRAEGMTPIGAGFASQFDGAAEEDFIDRAKRLRWHEVSKPYATGACQVPDRKRICK